MAGHQGKTLETVDSINVIECADCGFAHVLPFPSAEDYAKTYREDYYEKVWPDYFARFEADLSWWELAYSERYRQLESWLEPSSRALLDIGSGPGYFLHTGKKRGWNVQGIEPSKQAWQYSTAKLGLEVRNAFLEKDTYPANSFQAVHLSEVLEHIPSPVEFLKIIGTLLAPDGYLCLVVPNDFNPFQKALRGMGFAPWWVAPKHHLNYFSAKSLTSLVEKNGFTVEKVTTTFPIDLFLLMGDNYIGNDTLGRAVHGKRKTMELNLDRAGLTDLRLKMYEAWSQLGVGREIILYAKKRR